MKRLVRYFVLGLALAIVLSPASAQRRAMQTGHIEIITNPPGFEIVVNGTKRPEHTNATVELPEGRYEIELVWPSSSYRHSFSVEVLPGDVLTQRFDLRASVPAAAQSAQAAQRQRRAMRTGYLEIITEPPGLEIFVDGAKRKERTNANLELAEGRHQIELVLPATAYRHAFDVQM